MELDMFYADYLIVGGGIAGTTAAETIRKYDKNGAIIIVSEEPHTLYSRVLLPHYVRGKVSREKVFLKNNEWYEEYGIELVKGRTLRELRLAAREAVLDDGAVYKYRKLLIAAGGKVRRLPVPEITGVTYFRTIEDADAILAALRRIDGDASAPRVGVIYGGGFIGLEYAVIFYERGLRGELVLRGDKYWGPYFDKESEDLLVKILEDHDIHLHRNMESVKVDGSELLAVDISGRKIESRILGVGIGIIPNLEPARSGGLETGRGIICNEYLEASAPDVWTAGDIAEFMDLTAGRRRILGNWINAVQQGMRAGANMAGDKKPFEMVSSYSIRPFGTSVTFVGDLAHLPGTDIIVRGSYAEGSVGQIFTREGRAVGATFINMNKERLPVTELIKRKSDVRGLEKQLADAGADLAALL